MTVNGPFRSDYRGEYFPGRGYQRSWEKDRDTPVKPINAGVYLEYRNKGELIKPEEVISLVPTLTKKLVPVPTGQELERKIKVLKS